MVHGFTQTSRCWGPFSEALAHRHELLTVDAPGHGRSSHISAALPEAAALTVATGGRGAYLGYSMGARICLAAALDHPREVTRLVLVSGSPGIADPAERNARREADEVLADSIVEVETFIDRWLMQPLFAGLDPGRAERKARLENTPEGLRSSLRMCGAGAQEPLWGRLSELSIPVLLVTGSDDPKYCSLAEEMVAGIGTNASLAVIPGAGHTVHLEKPRETAGAVLEFLAR